MTNADQDRLESIHRMPCIACVKNQNFRILYPTEAHHIVDNGYREHSGGHQSTLPLCDWHHRGICRCGYNPRQMEELCGPSFAISKRQFIAIYGTERELEQEVNKILTEAA